MHRPAVAALVLFLAAAARAQEPAPTRADSARRLPGVVVTATRDSISPLASPLPTATLDRAALRREHGVSLAHTVARLPGVRSLSTGEQIGKPLIRGLAGSRVLVLDDGLRLEDYSWSDEDGPSIDARLAERVEVIRGPASVLYGSDAIGGVVNAIPAPLPDARGAAPIRRGELELYGATNNLERGAVLRGEGARGAVAGRVVLVGRFGGDLRTPAGDVRNTGFAAGDGEAALGLHHASGAESTLRLAHYGGEYRLLEIDAPPGGEAPEGEEGPERVTLDDRLQLSHRRRAGALDLEVRGQLQRHLLQEKADLPDPQPGQPREATVFDLLLRTATVELLAHHGALAAGVPDDAGWRGTVGVSGLVQENDSRGVVPLVPDATVASAGAFAFERLALGRLALLAGVRGDVRRLRARGDERLELEGETRSHAALTADLGAVYRLRPALSLAVNVGSAWRAPNLFELFANGPRLGEGRYEYGEPELDPERSLALDATLRWDAPRAHAEVTAFRTRIADYIFLAPTDRAQDGLRVHEYGQGDATLVGGEGAAELAATDALTLRGRVDAVRGTNTTTHDPLPLMPPLRAAIGAELHAAGDPLDGPYLSVELEHVARASRLSAAERDAEVRPGRFPLATGAHTLLDLGAGVVLPLGGHAVRLDLQARNATNRRYRDFLSRYKEFAYAPGTNVIVRASTAF
jgi:outer membrane receptor protein involved in Fe transport